MKTKFYLLLVLTLIFAFTSCKKQDENSITDKISGEYKCKIGSADATAIISKQSENEVNIRITTSSKSEIAFNQVSVIESTNKPNCYTLNHDEIISGKIFYVNYNYGLDLEWAEGKINGYYNVKDNSISKEIVGVYSGEYGNYSATTNITEQSPDMISLKIISTQSEFPAVNLSDIAIQKYVVDTADYYFIRYILSNSNIRYSEIIYTSFNSEYDLQVSFTDNKIFHGILKK